MSAKHKLTHFIAGAPSEAEAIILIPGGIVSSSYILLNPGDMVQVEFREIGDLKNGAKCYTHSNGVTNKNSNLELESDPIPQGEVWLIEVKNVGSTSVPLNDGDHLVHKESESDYRIPVFVTSPSTVEFSDPVISLDNSHVSCYLNKDIVDVAVIAPGYINYEVWVRATPSLSINVEEFGAVGDGVTDDRPAIQAAIDYLDGLGGGTIRLLERKYVIGEIEVNGHQFGLVMKSNIELRGSAGRTTLLVPESSQNYNIIEGESVENAKILDIFFDGGLNNRLNNDSVHKAVRLHGSKYCVIEGCSFHNFGSRPQHGKQPWGTIVAFIVEEDGLSGSEGNRVVNNYFFDPSGFSGFAIRIWSSWYEDKDDDAYQNYNVGNFVQNNYIQGTRWNAIEIVGPATRSNTISGNIVKGFRGHRAIESDKGSRGNLFINNIVDGLIPVSLDAPYSAFCDQGTPAGTGDPYTHPERISQDNVWIGNIAQNANQFQKVLYGFYCNFSKRTIIKGLQVSNFTPTDNSCTGIFVEDRFDEIRIDGCIVNNVPRGVVFGNGDSQGSGSVINCELHGTYRSIEASSSSGTKTNLVIAGNNITCDTSEADDAEGTPYSIVLGGFDRVSITGNTISGEQIYLSPYFTGRLSFVGNCCFGIEQKSAFQIEKVFDPDDESSCSAVVVGNDFSDCHRGIGLESRSDRCVVVGNSLSMNDEPECYDRGVGTLIGENHSDSRFVAKQEEIGFVANLNIRPNTDTVVVSGSGNVSSLHDPHPGRRISLISRDGNIQIVHQSSQVLTNGEFVLQNGVNVTLGINELIAFEALDLGNGIVVWLAN